MFHIILNSNQFHHLFIFTVNCHNCFFCCIVSFNCFKKKKDLKKFLNIKNSSCFRPKLVIWLEKFLSTLSKTPSNAKFILYITNLYTFEFFLLVFLNFFVDHSNRDQVKEVSGSFPNFILFSLYVFGLFSLLVAITNRISDLLIVVLTTKENVEKVINLSFLSVLSKWDSNTSNLVSTILPLSSSNFKGEWNEKIIFDLFSANSEDSRGLVFVCSFDVSVLVNNKNNAPSEIFEFNSNVNCFSGYFRLILFVAFVYRFSCVFTFVFVLCNNWKD